jgi:hypothetical protein
MSDWRRVDSVEDGVKEAIEQRMTPRRKEHFSLPQKVLLCASLASGWWRSRDVAVVVEVVDGRRRTPQAPKINAACCPGVQPDAVSDVD